MLLIAPWKYVHVSCTKTTTAVAVMIINRICITRTTTISKMWPARSIGRVSLIASASGRAARADLVPRLVVGGTAKQEEEDGIADLGRPLLRDERRVLAAHRRHVANVGQDAAGVLRHLRAVGPAAAVPRRRFF